MLEYTTVEPQYNDHFDIEEPQYNDHFDISITTTLI